MILIRPGQWHIFNSIILLVFQVLLNAKANIVYNYEGDEVVRLLTLDRRFAGKGSNLATTVTLKRAFIGHNLYADGKHRIDMEIGRWCSTQRYLYV